MSLQSLRDDGAGAVAVGDNLRLTEHTWDPEQILATVARAELHPP